VNNVAEIEPIKSGAPAPDFVLKDQNENKIKLSELKGKRVLLSFHPLAWTSICAQQMQSIETNYNKLQELGTVPFGLSVDSVPCKKAWAENLGLDNLQILADFWPHGQVARSFGIFLDERGISSRANIILDRDLNVIFVKVYPIKELPDIQEILKVLEEL
jgi:peroxiredoxin